MARRRGEAWVTYVVNDTAVSAALVLAASLRITRTTRNIAVILSPAVSKESGKILRQGFDASFLLDSNLVSYNGDGGKSRTNYELEGKIFAFSLEIYEKCIFLPPTTIALENCDNLFDCSQAKDLAIKNLSGDMDTFLFTPSLVLCEFLEETRKTRHLEVREEFINCVSAWLKNNKPNSTYDLQQGSDEWGMGAFSVKKGQLLMGSGIHQLKIINFMAISENDAEFVAALKLFLASANGGLTEKRIVMEWLKIYEQHVASRALLNWKNDVKQSNFDNEPIAIVGMSCRFPGANNLEEFWNLLHSGEEGICVPPKFRWTKEHSVVGGLQKERETNAGFLAVPVDEFDAKFFGISPKEMEFVDPQARLLHEVMWEGLEDGGINPHGLRGSHTGIFTGSWTSDYRDIVRTSAEGDFFRAYMGNGMGATAARLSFLLGLTGPSIATESGCSSAIVAVDLAIKSLRNGETNLAIAGGVNLLLHPYQGSLSEYIMAPDGRCKTFDEKANGFGRAEGCGVLILKRFSDALRDRDHIWAIVRGSAISQEGMSRSMGTPTVHCEALAMELALSDAGVCPEEVSFVETHGTGTAVGDPMEVAAITKVYHSNARKDPLIIGSVKTNVGHTESCAGITGIIKTVLAMQHEVIPKHLNFNTLNPNINLEAIPAKLPLEPIHWPKVQGHPRIAGVSSFGITGTDGHVVIEEAPEWSLPKFTVGLERPLHLIKFSAKTEEALEDTLKSYSDLFTKPNPDLMMKDIAYSANTGRASFNHRAFLLAETCDQAATALLSDKLFLSDTSGTSCKELGKICFLFTGQGSQYRGMAKILYETSPVFCIHFDQCDNILRHQYNLSLREALWESDGKSNELSRTIYSQTSIFCIEYCLLKLWESWGIQPDCVLGHSLGEFCAAVAAGIMTFEDALMLVAERSRLIDNLPRGSMLVIKASQPDVEKMQKNTKIEVNYAAVNASDQTVVAGDTEIILNFLEVCKCNGLKAVVLEATHAFHSRHMDPMLAEYQKVAETVQYSKSLKCRYLSGVRGALLENLDSEINAGYWVDHTREKVSFLEACNSLKQLNCQHFVEIGPHPVLSTFVMQNIDNQPVSCYPSLRRSKNDWETILISLGKLYLNGVTVDWEGFDKPYDRKKMSSCLPFHPFHRKSFWADCSSSRSVTIHPLIGSLLSNASTLNIFQNSLNLKSVPFVKDHCIGERIIMPGAAFAEMCLSAGHCVTNSLTDTLERPTRPVALENLRIEAPLAITEGKPCSLQVIVDLLENSTVNSDENSVQNGFRIKIFQQRNVENDSQGKWLLHASSTFHPVVPTQDIMRKWNASRLSNLMSSSEGLSTLPFYKRIEGVGLKFGDAFKSIQRYWSDLRENKMDEIVAEVQLPTDHDNYLLHPIVTDAMIQTAVLSSLQTSAEEVLMVPTRIGKLVWLRDPAGPSSTLYIYTRRENDNCFIFAADETFNPIAYMTDVQMIETNVKTIESILEQQNNPLPDSWEETWRPIPGPLDNRCRLPNWEPLLNTEEFTEKLQKVSAVAPEDWEHSRKMKRLIFLYQVKALLTLGWEPLKGERIEVREFCERHGILSKYHQLLHHYFSVCQDENGMMTFHEEEDLWQVASVPPPEGELEVEIAELNAALKREDKVAVFSKILRVVGERLPKLLTGEESALQLLFPTEAPQQTECSADLFYQNHPGRSGGGVNAAEIFTAIAQKFRQENEHNPKAKLRVLEFGAGTGALTEGALSLLATEFGGEFEYYYTDISGYFFPKAEKKLEEFKKNLKFAVFDIEKGGLSQGIPVNYFDLVLGLEVLHATTDLEKSLGNLREVLRPGGTLHFTETIVQDRAATFVFGLLEGYWRFQDFHWRPRHACVGKDTWRDILHQSGYDYVHSTGVYMDTIGVFIANASNLDILPTSGRNLSTEQSKWVIFGSSDDLHGDLIERLSRCGFIKVTLVLSSRDGTDATWSDTTDIKLVDLDSSDLADQIKSILEEVLPHGVVYSWGMDTVTRDQGKIARPFLHLAKITLTLKPVPKLFVCTRGVHPVGVDTYVCSNPSAATLFGMVKSLKNENSDMLVRCIDLGKDRTEVVVNQILYELAMHKTSREKNRVSVAYRDGQRYEPMFSRANLRKKGGEELKLPPCTDRYQLVLPASKMIQDLQYDALLETSVGDFEVEVKTKAYALNFKDVLTILKPTEEFQNYNGVGIDFAGVVTKVGKGVPQEKVKIGDRVFGVNTKDVPLSSHLIVDAAYVIKIPERMTYAEAATLPAVFSTSILCLVDVAQMKKGETVLIHTGSGGVGLAAIQLARKCGANIITTAGNPRKRAYLKSLGIEHVFHSRDTSYREEILKVTQGRGVDIVLNSITGEGFKEASLDVVTKNGRFVEMSKLGAWSEEEVRERRPDVKYTIVDLTDKAQISWDNLIERVQGYLQEGSMHPIPHVKFDALLIRQALQFLQKAKHIGKVVVTMPEVKTVEGEWKVTVPLFNGDSTYLITGGLGGIGFEVCKWMLEKGAVHIVLIGRSPPQPEIAQGITRLNASNQGYKITVKQGDIGDWEQCKTIIDEIVENCGDKPLRGIHHCAGLLSDNLYPNQTWESYQTTFNPKVEGTWNLHHLTRYLPLEHFVLYSSMTALAGTPGQSNHAAANCFEDAFAHYRYSLGLPATAINWGQWSQVGSAKDISLTGVLPVSVKRMLNGLEVTLRNQLTQVCFGEFESFHLLTVICPIFTHYLDKRLRQTLHSESTQVHLKSDQFWKEVEEAEGKPQKLEVVTLYMKAILRGALRMEADEALDENANMQDLGVDSLMLIELKNSIQGLMGTRLNVTNTMLKDCHTVKDLSTVIVNKLCDEEEAPADALPLSPEEYSKLLETDCILEETIHPTLSIRESVTAIKYVLITGVTGQLGPYMLSKLYEPTYDTVEKIMCLIRTEGGQCPKEKLQNTLESLNLASGVDMRKVECIRGDVTKFQFGLTEGDYQRLAESVGGVIHLAAKVDYAEPYRKWEGSTSDIRSVNVEGTLNILRFAVTGKTKHVYYASSIMSVVGGNKGTHLCDDWPEQAQIQIIAKNNIPGYPASKYVCEMLLKQANERGVPCKIFRFPWVLGDSALEPRNSLNNPYIVRFLSYLKQKAMPAVPSSVILLPLETCADWSLKLFWNENAPNEIYNILPPNPPLEGEFVEVAKECFGVDLELVEGNDERVEENGPSEDMSDSLKEFYENVNQIIASVGTHAFTVIKGYRNSPAGFFTSQKVETHLPEEFQEIPATMDIVRQHLLHLRSKGFF